jgi:glyoxylase-like metal-dependent hydrolase (beta-lactamase superfamily II)
MPRPTPPTTQSSRVYHKKIGDVVVTAINDGMFEGAFEMLAGFPTAEAEALHKAVFRAIPPRLVVNCFLIQTGERLALVDSGFGGAIGPLAGHLTNALQHLGVTPADIDTVLCTHLHPDHVGGLVGSDGAALFPNAELVVHPDDYKYWGDDATLAAATTDQDRGFVQLARATIAAYADRTRLLSSGEALPSISILHEPGHTPGHSGWMVTSGGESLLIWGDIVHMPGIQFAGPDAGVGFDVDGPGAVATRQRIMDMTATDQLLVAGMHLDFPCFGHVARATSGYAFVPEVWTPHI